MQFTRKNTHYKVFDISSVLDFAINKSNLIGKLLAYNTSKAGCRRGLNGCGRISSNTTKIACNKTKTTKLRIIVSS